MGFHGGVQQLIMSLLGNYCKVQCRKRHVADISKLLQTLFVTAAHEVASTNENTLSASLSPGKITYWTATLGSVPEHNKRCVPCTINRKFEVFFDACSVVNQSSNITKSDPLPSSVANNNSFIWLAREKISCLCSVKTALKLMIGGVLTRHLLYVHQYMLTYWYLSYPNRMITIRTRF